MGRHPKLWAEEYCPSYLLKLLYVHVDSLLSYFLVGAPRHGEIAGALLASVRYLSDPDLGWGLPNRVFLRELRGPNFTGTLVLWVRTPGPRTIPGANAVH